MRSWLIFLSFFVAMPSFAENVKPFLASGEALTGGFIQERYLKDFDAPIRSEGRFVIVPNLGLSWRTETPFETSLIISQEGILQTVAGEETLRLPTSRFPAMETLREILEASLTGDWSILEQKFGAQPRYQAGRWTLEIAPEQSETQLPFTEIKMEGGAFVERVIIQRKGGDYDIISFTDQKSKAIDALGPDEMPRIKGGT